MAQFAVEYGDKPPVKVAARLLQQFQYQYKNYLNCAVIVCGYDNLEGPCIYEIGMGGTVTKRVIAMNGSGSHYINGYVDKNFKENMTKEEAKEFLKNAVTLAMLRDSHSGGIIRLLDITKDLDVSLINLFNINCKLEIVITSPESTLRRISVWHREESMRRRRPHRNLSGRE